MNKLDNYRKGTFNSNFDFSILYTKLPCNKFPIVLNSLTDFPFYRGESKCITFNSYGARWVKNIKDKKILKISC